MKSSYLLAFTGIRTAFLNTGDLCQGYMEKVYNKYLSHIFEGGILV